MTRMHDSPSVSVIVPFFNRRQSLAACIEALLGQESIGGPVQIILVDNGSNDDSRAVIARYTQVTVLAEATPGAYAARNTGIRQATAPIIAFTDRWPPTSNCAKANAAPSPNSLPTCCDGWAELQEVGRASRLRPISARLRGPRRVVGRASRPPLNAPHCPSTLNFALWTLNPVPSLTAGDV